MKTNKHNHGAFFSFSLSLVAAATLAAITSPVSANPPAPASHATPGAPHGAAPHGAAPKHDAVTFDIKRFEVEGNTLGGEVTDKLLAPYTGHNKTLDDVNNARTALQKAYGQKGDASVAVVIPPQEMTQGVIRLKVAKAVIGNVHVTGNKHFSATNIRNSLPALKEGAALDHEALAADLRLANTNPAKKSLVVMKPSGTQSALDAEVEVKDEKPWKVYGILENTGFEQTGRHRLIVGYQHANVMDRDHVAGIQYVTSVEEPNMVKALGGSYTIPLYNNGDALMLFGGVSDVDGGTVANVFDISGKGTVVGARYHDNFARRGNFEHKAVYGFDYRAYEQSVLFLKTVQLASDVTVSPVSAAYVGNWREAGKVDASAQASLHVNIPTGGAGSDAAFNAARANADAGYSLVRYAADYARTFGHDWSARASISGQYANQELVPPEQFKLGGANGVRGFNEGEILDDKGYRGSLEVFTPNFLHGRVPDFSGRAVVFYDFGAVDRVNPLVGERRDETIASAGIGLRLDYGTHVKLKLDLAQVTDAGGTKRNGDNTLHAALLLMW